MRALACILRRAIWTYQGRYLDKYPGGTMAGRPIDKWYAKRLLELFADRLEPSAAYDQLKADARRERPGGKMPNPRTVKRHYERWRGLPEDVREEQRRFRWPDSLPADGFSWGSGRAALDLVRYRDEN